MQVDPPYLFVSPGDPTCWERGRACKFLVTCLCSRCFWELIKYLWELRSTMQLFWGIYLHDWKPYLGKDPHCGFPGSAGRQLCHIHSLLQPSVSGQEYVDATLGDNFLKCFSWASSGLDIWCKVSPWTDSDFLCMPELCEGGDWKYTSSEGVLRKISALSASRFTWERKEAWLPLPHLGGFQWQTCHPMAAAAAECHVPVPQCRGRSVSDAAGTQSHDFSKSSLSKPKLND